MNGTDSFKQPQINWYREYVLEPNANVTLKFEGSTAEADKQKFENSLYKKIWGAELADDVDYPNSAFTTQTPTSEEPYYIFKYGVNAANAGCAKSMLFGITLKYARTATTNGTTTTYGEYAIKSGYLFIVAAYEENEGTTTKQKVRVRSHQLVVIPNTEFVNGTDKWGIQVTDGDIVIGIKKVTASSSSTTDYDFYFPMKSFFLEGRHQEPVQFVSGYDGKFTITLL